MKQKKFFLSVLLAVFISCGFSSCELEVNEPTKIDETTIFTTRYEKDDVWDAFRSPAYPAENEDWFLYNFKGALDPDGGSLDWGTARYLKFVAVVDSTNSIYSITDDLYNIGEKYTIKLKLHESNGTLVKVVSDYGQIIGIGDKGFVYVAEGYYGMFFPTISIKSGDEVIYKPTTVKVTKLSQLYK